VQTNPPSPVVIVLSAKKEKVATSPKDPQPLLFHFIPNA